MKQKKEIRKEQRCLLSVLKEFNKKKKKKKIIGTLLWKYLSRDYHRDRETNTLTRNNYLVFQEEEKTSINLIILHQWTGKKKNIATHRNRKPKNISVLYNNLTRIIIAHPCSLSLSLWRCLKSINTVYKSIISRTSWFLANIYNLSSKV